MLSRLKLTKFANWYNKYNLAISMFMGAISLVLLAIIVVNVTIQSAFLNTVIAIAFIMFAISKLLEICFSNDTSRKTIIYNYILFVLYIGCIIINLF